MTQDYFKILPNEIVLKILLFLSPKERFPLERVGDRRLRHLVISLVTNYECLGLRLNNYATKVCILKYRNIESLGDWSVISKGLPGSGRSNCAMTMLQDLLLDEPRCQDFAKDLAIACPHIRKFFTTYRGLDLVSMYAKSLDGEYSKIEELSVYVPPILASKLWHLIEDISIFSPRLRTLRIICLRHPVLLDSSSWDAMWETLNKIRVLQLEFCHEFDYLHNHFTTSFKGLECLLIDHLEESELEVVVANNRGLRRLEVKELYSGYHHLAHLTKLESLKVIWVKQRLTFESQRYVLESIGTNLREFSVYLREKSSCLKLIPRYCKSIQEFTVYGFVLEDKKYFVNNLVKTCQKLSCLKKLNLDFNGFNTVDILDIERFLPLVQVSRY